MNKFVLLPWSVSFCSDSSLIWTELHFRNTVRIKVISIVTEIVVVIISVITITTMIIKMIIGYYKPLNSDHPNSSGRVTINDVIMQTTLNNYLQIKYSQQLLERP